MFKKKRNIANEILRERTHMFFVSSTLFRSDIIGTYEVEGKTLTIYHRNDIMHYYLQSFSSLMTLSDGNYAIIVDDYFMELDDDCKHLEEALVPLDATPIQRSINTLKRIFGNSPIKTREWYADEYAASVYGYDFAINALNKITKFEGLPSVSKVELYTRIQHLRKVAKDPSLATE